MVGCPEMLFPRGRRANRAPRSRSLGLEPHLEKRLLGENAQNVVPTRTTPLGVYPTGPLSAERLLLLICLRGNSFQHFFFRQT